MWADQGGSKAESSAHQVQWNVKKVGLRRLEGTGEDVRLLPAINRAVIIFDRSYLCQHVSCQPNIYRVNTAVLSIQNTDAKVYFSYQHKQKVFKLFLCAMTFIQACNSEVARDEPFNLTF